MKKIFSIGSATEDIFMLYEGAETLHLLLQKKEESYLILEQGTKIDIPALHYASGGGATNAAVGFKRLGLEVDAFFKLGADAAGQFVYEDMLKEKIGIQHCLVEPGTSTAISFIVPSLEHNHVALCYRGANTKLTKEEFPFEQLKNYQYLYVSSLSGHSGELLPAIATKAKELHIPIATNPSMTQILHETNYLISAFPAIDILIVNAYEASHLMRKMLGDTKGAALQKNKTSYSDTPKLIQEFMWHNGTHLTLRDYFNELFKRGISSAVVTNGAEGVYVATKDAIYFHPSLKSKVLFGLGAGDAFSSAFIGSLALGFTLEQSLLHGIINARSVIHYADTKQGLLTLDELTRNANQIAFEKLQNFSR